MFNSSPFAQLDVESRAWFAFGVRITHMLAGTHMSPHKYEGQTDPPPSFHLWILGTEFRILEPLATEPDQIFYYILTYLLCVGEEGHVKVRDNL